MSASLLYVWDPESRQQVPLTMQAFASADGTSNPCPPSYLPVEYQKVGQIGVYLSGVFADGKLYESDLVTQVAIGTNPGNAIAGSIRASQPAFDIASSWTQAIVLAEFDDEAVRPLTGDYPALNDPRWVDIELPFPCRTLYMSFSDWEMQNLLSSADASWYLYADIDGDVIQLNIAQNLATRAVRNTGNLAVSFPLAYQKTSLRLLIQFVASGLSQSHNTLVVHDGQISIGSGQQLNSVLVGANPVRIRFNYDRNGATNQGAYQGAQASILDSDPVTNSISYDWGGFVPPVGSEVRFLSTVAGAIAPAGISFVIEPKTFNPADNTIMVRGSYEPIPGEFYRAFIISGSQSGITNGSFVTFSSVTPLGNGLYSCKLAQNSIATFSDRGTVTSNRYWYASPVESRIFTVLAGNRFSLNGVDPVDLFYEYQSIGTCTAGVASRISFGNSNHGFQVGDLAEIGLASVGGAQLPSGVTVSSKCFWVVQVIANNIVVSQRPGGLPVAFTTSGSGITIQRQDGFTSAANVLTGSPSTFQVGDHGLPSGSKFRFLGGTIPGSVNLNMGFHYYLATVGNNSGQVTIADVPGGLPVATEFAATDLQIGITNTATGNTPANIELAEYWLARASESGRFDLLPSENGDPLVLRTANSTAISIAAVDPVKVSCKVAIAGFR